MLFHMVASVLFSMAALSTAISKILIGCWRIFDQSENGWKSYHGKQNRGYHVKEHKNWTRKWCVINEFTFCLGSPVIKTNSAASILPQTVRISLWPSLCFLWRPQLYGFNAHLFNNLSEAMLQPHGVVAVSIMIQESDRAQQETHGLKAITSHLKKVSVLYIMVLLF